MDLQKIANVIRGLSADAIEAANSGHPGAPLGCAEIGSVLFFDVLKHNPANSKWPNRDRFVLSGGHGSMLLYSLLHLTGYDVSLDDLKRFRQLGSNTPGHPEYGHTDGVEATTGPLGQGVGNAVGMAIAERMAAARFNRPGYEIVDHYTFALAGDGDLMEGVSAEASSLAGHLKLGKLIVIYDSNQITIEGPTELTFTESVAERYKAYGWHVLDVDGHDLTGLEKVIAEAKAVQDRPTLIVAQTRIAKGAPTKEGTAASHGAPLGKEEVAGLKKALGLPVEEKFYVPEDVKALRQTLQSRGKELEKKWLELKAAWAREYSDLAQEWESWQKGEVPASIDQILSMFPAEGEALATRAASGKILNALAPMITNLVGGSADLAPSTSTYLQNLGDVSAEDFSGRNFRFGVREHGMAAVLNGISLHGLFRVFGATFLVFSDYMRGALRVSALMGQPVVYVLTHDSAFVGEDGPTHHPVEHTESLRLIPNLRVFRPADGEETAWSWYEAVKRTDGPSVLILTRQKLPALKKPEGWDFTKGAYVLKKEKGQLDLVIAASGSEVSLAQAVCAELEEEGYGVRLVSVPCRELFLAQEKEYRQEIIPAQARVLAVELGVTPGWYGIGSGGPVHVYGLDRFSKSGPGDAVAQHFGFSKEALKKQVLEIIKA